MKLSSPIMYFSCLVLGAAGIALIFFNQEILSIFNQDASATPVYQLMGALYFGFAIANWTAKKSILGGIYGRAITLGNFVHFIIGAIALFKLFMVKEDQFFLAGALAIYTLMAASFGYLLFTHPLKKN